MGFFSPKDTSYQPLFTRAGSDILSAVEILNKMTVAQGSKYQELFDEINALEEAADENRDSIRVWLANTFVTPFDRDDMFSLALTLDDIIDACHKVADTIYMYSIDDMPKKAAKQIEIISEMAKLIYGVSANLVAITSNSDATAQIKELFIACEKARRSILVKLFNEKTTKGKDVVTVIKTKDLTDALISVAYQIKVAAQIIDTIGIKGV